MDVCLSKLPLGWNGAYRHFRIRSTTSAPTAAVG